MANKANNRDHASISLTRASAKPRYHLATGLFVNDRKYELGNRFYLMTMLPRHHLFDKICDACRLNPCCHKRQQDYTSR